MLLKINYTKLKSLLILLSFLIVLFPDLYVTSRDLKSLFHRILNTMMNAYQFGISQIQLPYFSYIMCEQSHLTHLRYVPSHMETYFTYPYKESRKMC